MTAPAKTIPSPSPVLTRPVALPVQMIRRLTESKGPTYCPSCGEGENETTDGRESRKELCRMCAMAFEVEQLRSTVERLESRLRGMEAYHG